MTIIKLQTYLQNIYLKNSIDYKLNAMKLQVFKARFDLTQIHSNTNNLTHHFVESEIQRNK